MNLLKSIAVSCAVSLLGACAFHPNGRGNGDDEDAAVAIDAADIDADIGIDAAMIDAAMIDAAMIDAPMIDAAMPIDAPTIDAPMIDATMMIDAPTIDAPMIDAPIDAPGNDDIIHVFAADETIGTGDIVVAANAMGSTSNTPSAGFPLPAGTSFASTTQDPSGPQLAILHVHSLVVNDGVVWQVTGNRPLVIIADTVVVNGVIDVGSRAGTAGAGGMADGPGVGGAGVHLGTYSDSGGGGGSFGVSAGVAGGNAPCVQDCNPDMIATGGGGGTPYGTTDVARLQGGSGGGRAFVPNTPNNCVAGSSGAGGGAIQIYARSTILVGGNGAILAGGGGGNGGDMCNNPFNYLAGHGGGAGGAIYLQSTTVINTGQLAANGGGGGGGAGTTGDGGNGGNGGRINTVAAGGTASGMYSAAGGHGATQAMPAQTGFNSIDRGNGGGGGGGLGHIHVRYRTTGAVGNTSPSATTSTY